MRVGNGPLVKPLVWSCSNDFLWETIVQQIHIQLIDKAVFNRQHPLFGMWLGDNKSQTQPISFAGKTTV